MKNNLKQNIELFATRIAEVRMSQFGLRLIPGIYPVFKRLHQLISARALIVNPLEINI